MLSLLFFFFKQKTAYEMRISDWSSDVCSSDLGLPAAILALRRVDPQPVPDVADPPVQDRRQGGDATADAGSLRQHLLVPALPALRPVARAAHLDAAIADRGLALPHAGDHQHVAVELGDLRLEGGDHRVDLDLPCAPPAGVVVRLRGAPAEAVSAEGRRVGKEGVGWGRVGGWPY